MAWSLFFHLIGMVMWVGGLMMLTRVMQVFTQPYDGTAMIVGIARRLWKGFVLTGLVLSLVSGIAQLVLGGGPGLYLQQGWFHGKITLVMVLFAVTLLVGFEVGKVRQGQLLTRGKLIALHAATGVVLVGIVFLSMVVKRIA